MDGWWVEEAIMEGGWLDERMNVWWTIMTWSMAKWVKGRWMNEWMTYRCINVGQINGMADVCLVCCRLLGSSSVMFPTPLVEEAIDHIGPRDLFYNGGPRVSLFPSTTRRIWKYGMLFYWSTGYYYSKLAGSTVNYCLKGPVQHIIVLMDLKVDYILLL